VIYGSLDRCLCRYGKGTRRRVIPPYADRERSDLLPNANLFFTKLNWP
jgi:hypothetical protein